MEVLDTTIANVALRYIAGGLSAAVVDSEWVLTSYLAANAMILPISGWISARVGPAQLFHDVDRRVHHCLDAVRPGHQFAAVDCVPRHSRFGRRRFAAEQPGDFDRLVSAGKTGGAMTVFGIAALIGPVVGPTLGGYLTDNYNWRWIFYINGAGRSVRAGRLLGGGARSRLFDAAAQRTAQQTD